MSFPLTQEQFIKQSIKKHGNKYDYFLSQYKNARTKIIIICKEHGKFLQLAANHIRGSGCQECARKIYGTYRKSNTKDFIRNSKNIHGEKYDYSFVNYVNSDLKVKIICKQHGIFLQTPKHHLLDKSGCPKCRIKWGIGLYTNKLFQKHPELKNIIGNFYIVKFISNSENFYKIGITKNKLSQRFAGYKKYGYYINPIIIEKMNLEKAYCKEKLFKEKFKNYNYIPKHIFPGYKECFENKIGDKLCLG